MSPRVPTSTRPSRTTPISLAQLATLCGDRVEGLFGDSHQNVTGITLNSRRVCPGDLYAALPGAHTHGIDYASSALEAGAVAVITDATGAARLSPTSPVLAGVPVLVVADPRALLGRLSATIYGDPATNLVMIGVTGTQGKTTTTRLMESGLQGAGITAGVIGTVGTRIAGRDVPTSLTTPEAPDLHALFAQMLEQRVKVCAMEVSSHALVLGRVDGVVFDVAVFLNLGRDHLDFHADLADYYAAKASLFTPERAKRAVINIDDEFGRRLAGEATIDVVTVSTHSAADWTAVDVELGPNGATFVVVPPNGDRFEAASPLAGDFNVANTLTAIAAAAEAGLDPVAIAASIAASPGVPGRLERIDEGQEFTVVVDYAHKPDAVEAALRTLRPLTDGRVIVVLGAGGDRDQGKREVMGEIAGRLADLVIVTDDNPRSEVPATIRASIVGGAARGTAQVREIGDRGAAIAAAIEVAQPGDIVVIAGKGHESGQEIAGEIIPFDDRDVARSVLKGGNGPSEPKDGPSDKMDLL